MEKKQSLKQLCKKHAGFIKGVTIGAGTTFLIVVVCKRKKPIWDVFKWAADGDDKVIFFDKDFNYVTTFMKKDIEKASNALATLSELSCDYK